MCCNCRNFPILYKVVSFTLAGITSCILTWFLCAVNTHFLALLSELSSCLKYEAILKYCTNSLVKCQRTLSPMVVHVFLSQQSSTMLIPENLAQWWQKKTFPTPLQPGPAQTVKKKISNVFYPLECANYVHPRHEPRLAWISVCI